jgi:hypothetical protein
MDLWPSSAPKSASGCAWYACAIHLGTLVVVTDADGALVAETLAPEATDLNVGLGDALVGEEEPCTEDGLGEDVEDGVGNDLLVNVHVAGAISDTPDTRNRVSG